MIRDVAVEAQATEPAISQIEVDLVAQLPLRANAEAVADDQHADHQLGIDRRATRLAVVWLQMRPDLRKVDEPIDLAKQVIVRDMPFQAEAVEQRLLHQPPFAHHRESPRFIEKTESEPGRRRKRVFQHNLSTPVVPFAQIAVVPRRRGDHLPTDRREPARGWPGKAEIWPHETRRARFCPLYDENRASWLRAN